MIDSPKESFPKSCPSCGRPRRFITFTELTHSAMMPFIWIPLVDDRFKKFGPLFAECQACLESWVWVRETQRWINAREFQNRAGTRAMRGKNAEVRNRIGRVY